jgi:hypothetical protein
MGDNPRYFTPSKKNHTVRTFPKLNWKIVETDTDEGKL